MVAPCRDEILDVGDGVAVRNGLVAQGSVVAAGPPVTGSLLRYHVMGRRPVTGRRADNTELQHVVKLLASDGETFRSQTTRTGPDRRSSSLDVVCHIVSHRLLTGTGLGDCGELCKDSLEIVRRRPRSKRGTGRWRARDDTQHLKVSQCV